MRDQFEISGTRICDGNREREVMRKCHKCGVEFINHSQKDYHGKDYHDKDYHCGELPKTIAEYIAVQNVNVQPRLQELYATIKNSLPDAMEKISWNMPTFWKKKNLIHFAAFKNHIGLYPGPAAIVHFTERLIEYKTSKGAIQLAHNKPLPTDIIAEIVLWCENNAV